MSMQNEKPGKSLDSSSPHMHWNVEIKPQTNFFSYKLTNWTVFGIDFIISYACNSIEAHNMHECGASFEWINEWVEKPDTLKLQFMTCIIKYSRCLFWRVDICYKTYHYDQPFDWHFDAFKISHYSSIFNENAINATNPMR